MTAQEAVWSLGVPMLVAAGQADRNARSLLGKWCKAYGAPAVQAAIIRCAHERQLDPVRQRVVINMAFNMQGGLLTFTNTLAAMKRGDYAAAADGMLASKWAAQVGARATRLATMMRSGA
ncbi:hypothetical protein [Burkholderia metallica]